MIFLPVGLGYYYTCGGVGGRSNCGSSGVGGRSVGHGDDGGGGGGDFICSDGGSRCGCGSDKVVVVTVRMVK